MGNKIAPSPSSTISLGNIQNAEKKALAQELDEAGNDDGVLDRAELDAFEMPQNLGNRQVRVWVALSKDLDYGGEHAIRPNLEETVGKIARDIGDWLGV